MGFLDPDIHKLKNGKYRARLTWQDLDETSGTLADLKLWVESLIKHHGEAAEFEIEHPEDEDGGRASYCIERDATDKEIQGWNQRRADARLKDEAREREEYEKLRAKADSSLPAQVPQGVSKHTVVRGDVVGDIVIDVRPRRKETVESKTCDAMIGENTIFPVDPPHLHTDLVAEILQGCDAVGLPTGLVVEVKAQLVPSVVGVAK